ncbi:hypothetical protein PFICI_00785 [Pestalotiopsis fici W106-1]|uniref:Heterokaryon incompatibility domain-containing protein n=1 Tax=Pestalotiopsis fici (strain W106-1 / CGMCC3.15140) TaxID=1229662 RepID=W3XN66_PESFW|nr:uncharacterized protein PFICI_00785 [Pestalotiopsis fici W106-1]ETS86957.1 hypothetical protein PFICI_00785 [Pestalotiopsis fici W106-1]
MERRNVYQALAAPESIRLLRLLPSTNAHAPLRGQLFECNIMDFYGKPSSFEALSYVWGDPKQSHFIFLDGSEHPITSNLHAALTHLRGLHGERLLWADALCINQKDDREKEHQIGLMYQIYASASRVVVWLGEKQDGSDHAFQDLRVIGRRRSTESVTDQRVLERIFLLFHRQWFRRIWVLQEVGAARHILIQCGHSTIDGYAFSLAANVLKPLFSTRAESRGLQNTVQSLAYLIQGSVHRQPYQGFGAPSDGIAPFGELIDMFHDREATVAHDKVFALLGMSSHDMTKSGLEPDYTIPLGQLFNRLVKFILSDRILVDCRKEKEVAVIKATGYVIGNIYSVGDDAQSFNLQRIRFHWTGVIDRLASDDSELSSHGTEAEVENDEYWKMPASSTPVQKGDLICLLDGSVTPTIIRVYKDFSVVVVASATLSPRTEDNNSDLWEKRVKQLGLPKRDLLLVWDWYYTSESYSRLANYRAWAISNDWGTEDPVFVANKSLNDLSRHLDHVLILSDGFGYNERLLRELLMHFGTAIQTESSRTMCEKRFADFLYDISTSSAHAPPIAHGSGSYYIMPRLLNWAVESHNKIAAKLIIASGGLDDISLYGSDSELPSPFQMAVKSGDMDMIGILLQAEAVIHASAVEPEGMTALQAAAKHGNITVVECLIQLQVDVNAKPPKGGRTALQAAAEQGHVGVVERLLQAKADVNAKPAEIGGRTALQAASQNGHVALVERLLQAKADVDAQPADDGGRTALQAAAEQGHMAVVERLIKAEADVNGRGAFDNGILALSAAAGNGHLAVVECLLDGGARIDKVAWGQGGIALHAAAENGHRAIVERLLETKASVDKADKHGVTALMLASKQGHVKVVDQLLRAGAYALYPDDTGVTALMWASLRGHIAIVERLIEADGYVHDNSRGGKALDYALRNGHHDIVKRLEEQGALVSYDSGYYIDENDIPQRFGRWRAPNRW